MTYNYSVSLSDPNGFAQDSALLANVQAAASEWSRYISGFGSLDIQVNVTPTTRANAGPATVVYLSTEGSNQIFELGTVNELRTGTDANGASPDFFINIDPNYLQTLWLNSSVSIPVPSNKIDGLSVFMHEIGHGLGFLGYRNPLTGALAGYETPWDRHVTVNDDGSASFGGNISTDVYGSIVPITVLQNGEQYNHIGNDVGERAGQDLMNGVAFYYGQRYAISDLDLAVLKDIGLSVTAVVGDYSATQPVVVPKITSVVTGDAVTGTSGVEGTGVLANSSDADIFQLSKNSFSVSALSGGIVGQTVSGTYGHLILNADGSYSYSADRETAIAAGTLGSHLHDVFSYIVSNGYGGSTASTLDVVLDRAPVTHGEAGVVTAGGTATGTAGAGGTGALAGAFDPDGDAFVISAIAGQPGNVGSSLAGQYGHLTLHNDGRYDYLLDHDQPIGGNDVYDTFNFAVSDEHGATTFGNLALMISGNRSADSSNEETEASSSTLILRVSEDAYQGDVQFIVDVDGQQVGSTQTTHALHAQGQWEAVTLHGSFADADRIAITFLNDVYGGPGQDRSLYIHSLSVNGQTFKGSDASVSTGVGQTTYSAELWTNGSAVFSVRPDTLVFRVAEDAYAGNAQFVVKADGQQIGGVQVAHAYHADGQWEDITLHGSFLDVNRISVEFLNDAYVRPGQDRNLYIDSISLNGHVIKGAAATVANGIGQTTYSAELWTNGSADFNVSSLHHADMFM